MTWAETIESMWGSLLTTLVLVLLVCLGWFSIALCVGQYDLVEVLYGPPPLAPCPDSETDPA